MTRVIIAVLIVIAFVGVVHADDDTLVSADAIHLGVLVPCSPSEACADVLVRGTGTRRAFYGATKRDSSWVCDPVLTSSFGVPQRCRWRWPRVLISRSAPLETACSQYPQSVPVPVYHRAYFIGDKPGAQPLYRDSGTVRVCVPMSLIQR